VAAARTVNSGGRRPSSLSLPDVAIKHRPAKGEQPAGRHAELPQAGAAPRCVASARAAAAMVLYYRTIDPSYVVYVGRDKHENEDLIKHGWDNDVWFHVDKLSSAHVYLRLNDGETIASIPEAVLQDCAQLVKHNSIEGNKVNNVGVVYTMWSNLKKTGDMAVGQVSFHDTRAVKRVVVEKRINEIVNRLNKTKTEGFPDLMQEKADRIKELNRRAREHVRKQAEADRAIREQRQREKQAKSYDNLHKPSEMTSNKDFRGTDPNEIEEDFM
jgi:NFACT protein RNA binding domain